MSNVSLDILFLGFESNFDQHQPESVVPENECTVGAERNRGADVRYRLPEVSGQDVPSLLVVASLGRQLDPEDRVLCRVEDGAVHLDRPADL